MPKQEKPFQFPAKKPIGKKHWTRTSYFDARHRKLSQQAPKPKTNILSGAVIYCTGVKSTSQRRLESLVQLNGGHVLKLWQRTRVTHVIGDSLAASKIEKELSLHNHSAPVVKPTWVFESIRSGRKLHTWPFQLVQGPPDINKITSFFKPQDSVSNQALSRHTQATMKRPRPH